MGVVPLFQFFLYELDYLAVFLFSVVLNFHNGRRKLKVYFLIPSDRAKVAKVFAVAQKIGLQGKWDDGRSRGLCKFDADGVEFFRVEKLRAR